MFVSAKGFAFCTSDLDAERSIDEKFEHALIVSITFFSSRFSLSFFYFIIYFVYLLLLILACLFLFCFETSQTSSRIPVLGVNCLRAVESRYNANTLCSCSSPLKHASCKGWCKSSCKYVIICG